MKRVLVIDDDQAIRKLIRTILGKEGFEILEAAGGKEGLRLFDPRSIDAVITDVLMPEIDGLAVIRQIRQQYPLTPIVALSGGGRVLTPEVSLGVAKKVGAFQSLAKPFTRSELLRAVRAVLEDADDDGQP